MGIGQKKETPMAEKRTIARPYAKAIFELAKQEHRFDKWSDMLDLLRLIVEDKQVKKLLRDPTLGPKTIAEFFLSVIKSTGKSLDEQGKNLLYALTLRKRLTLLPEIKFLYESFQDEALRILKVNCTTTIPLSKEEQQQYVEILSKRFERKIKMSCDVDPNLIGGFQLKAGDTVIDGSIHGQLMQLKEMMGG